MTNFHGLLGQSRFPLGVLHVTTAADDSLLPADIETALYRHARGDWGDVVNEDWLENVRSLKDGLRLHSVYHGCTGAEFWVITEWDRSVTTVLLPSDY